MRSIELLNRQIIACERCDRLRGYCAQVAAGRRRAYAGWSYWGRPVPGFGDVNGRLWIIGLAPAAHGANRTGRMFTGDRSGDFLFAALHRAGYANQPTSVSREDGLKLSDCYISAAVRCAPPDNKPTRLEAANCAPYLDREWELLKHKRVILALGRFAWDAALALVARQGIRISGKPAFSHGSVLRLREGLSLLGSYHVSQQNTFTGRLTRRMFDAVLARCRELAQ
ncbi:uracil-DNA glycosylase [Fontivita pretiosa]|uniref:uracil-DNA glycosylase n=1 Tax=Fontivita pretiosa TaxID=2989684 RepID=UPI003D180EA0